MFVARRPWALELYRRAGQEWQLVGKSELTVESLLLESAVFPWDFASCRGPTVPGLK